MAGSLLPEPKQQFLNDIGDPLFAGQIFTYAAGTLTPKATYQDQALTIANTNPVVANARGEVVMYGSGNYRLILKDLSGSTIYDRDNVETPDLVGNNLRADLALPSGASLSGFLQLGVGAKLRTLRDKGYESVTIEDFDGDTATAIERAFAVSPYLKFQPGKEYVIGRNITLTGPCVVDARGARLVGDGVEIKFLDAAGSSWLGGELNNISTPWTIVRDTVTWNNQTAANVTVSNLGYMPGPLDDDIYPGLSTAQKDQVAGIKLVFSSTTSAPQSGINIQGVRGRFTNIIFEGCINTSVSDIDIKGGKDYAGIVFYNDVNISRVSQAALGYTFARGYNNRVYSSTINGCTGGGVTFFGNDYWYLEGVHGIGTGESGLKTYQKDTTFGASVICKYGKAVNVSGIDNRFDGIDLSATFPTTGTESGHNIVIGALVKNNRATGLFSDAQSNQYSGIKALDNGLGGITVQAANLKVSDVTLENNTRKHGILGPINSYDIEVTGDNCNVSDVKITRNLPAPSVHAMVHNGTGGSNRDIDAPGLSLLIAPGNVTGMGNDNYRKTRVNSSFAHFYATGETTGIQSVIKVHREASDGQAIQMLHGVPEVSVGNISITSTSTSYNTSSDYRLKTSYSPVSNSGAYFDAAQPREWIWISNGKKGIGFIAHEFQQISPGSVSGEKDAVGEDGKPIYQSVEYGSSEWVANATAEIKDMRRRIAALEAK